MEFLRIFFQITYMIFPWIFYNIYFSRALHVFIKIFFQGQYRDFSRTFYGLSILWEYFSRTLYRFIISIIFRDLYEFFQNFLWVFENIFKGLHIDFLATFYGAFKNIFFRDLLWLLHGFFIIYISQGPYMYFREYFFHFFLKNF